MVKVSVQPPILHIVYFGKNSICIYSIDLWAVGYMSVMTLDGMVSRLDMLGYQL